MTDHVHGSIRGYREHHCRCDQCREAHRAYCARRRDSRKARGVVSPSKMNKKQLEEAGLLKECLVCVELRHFASLDWPMGDLARRLGVALNTLERHWRQHRPMGKDEPWPGGFREPDGQADRVMSVERQLDRTKERERYAVYSAAARHLGMSVADYRKQYGRSTAVARRMMEGAA